MFCYGAQGCELVRSFLLSGPEKPKNLIYHIDLSGKYLLLFVFRMLHIVEQEKQHKFMEEKVGRGLVTRFGHLRRENELEQLVLFKSWEPLDPDLKEQAEETPGFYKGAVRYKDLRK
jgi:hypothetical protein